MSKLNIAYLVVLLVFIAVMSANAHAGSSICSQIGNDQIVCQNYGDNGGYVNNSYISRDGTNNSQYNTWSGVSDKPVSGY